GTRPSRWRRRNRPSRNAEVTTISTPNKRRCRKAINCTQTSNLQKSVYFAYVDKSRSIRVFTDCKNFGTESGRLKINLPCCTRRHCAGALKCELIFRSFCLPGRVYAE